VKTSKLKGAGYCPLKVNLQFIPGQKFGLEASTIKEYYSTALLKVI
jgi:hypothetical protein